MFEVEPNHKIIQQIMGHAEISTTMDIYTHVTQEKMAESVQGIGQSMSLFK